MFGFVESCSASDACCFGSPDGQALVSLHRSCDPVSTCALLAPGLMHGDVEMLDALINQDTHFHWAQRKTFFGRMLDVFGKFQLLVIREDLLVSGNSSYLLRIRNNLLSFLEVVSECCPLYTKEGSSCFSCIVCSAVMVNGFSDDIRWPPDSLFL